MSATRATAPRVLVVQHEAESPAGLWETWLREAGLRLRISRPYLDEQLPEDINGFDGLLVLGGSPAPLQDDKYPWLPATRALLRAGMRYRLPTFGICLGAELMVTALGARVERREQPQVGSYDLKVLPAATEDPVFAGIGDSPPAVLWHQEEMPELPAGAVLLVSGTDAPNQAFRIGDRAWGTQFHPEASPRTVAQWAHDSVLLRRAAIGPGELVARVEATQEQAARAWRSVAQRWAALVHQHHRDHDQDRAERHIHRGLD